MYMYVYIKMYYIYMNISDLGEEQSFILVVGNIYSLSFTYTSFRVIRTNVCSGYGNDDES